MQCTITKGLGMGTTKFIREAGQAKSVATKETQGFILYVIVFQRKKKKKLMSADRSSIDRPNIECIF